jgi:hypothetical protein
MVLAHGVHGTRAPPPPSPRRRIDRTSTPSIVAGEEPVVPTPSLLFLLQLALQR